MNWISWNNPVSIWWVFLVFVAITNILAWIYTYQFINFKKIHEHSHLSKIAKYIVILSGLYVFGCAFRSFLPRADIQRICLFDTWFSSVLIGRTVATIAELGFVAQWALVLNTFAKNNKIKSVQTFSRLIVPFIFIAECFSWYAVIRTHYIGNMVEESIWGLTYVLIAISLFLIWLKIKGPLRYAAGVAVGFSILYVLFMFSIDVPMYYGRWQADLAANKPLLGFFEGLNDLKTRWVVTTNINDWKDEIPWMSLYFSFAVWTSLALCYVPLNKNNNGNS